VRVRLAPARSAHAPSSWQLLLAAVFGGISLTGSVLAQGPSYDCKKARGSIEALVCADVELGALDRTLAVVYAGARRKAVNEHPPVLKAEQRGWIKGRNDCWKATQQTWITATWTVKTVKDCIDAQYRVRTSELQAVWRLLPPKTVSYACQNNPANEVIVNSFASNPATIRLERGDRTATLWQVGATADGKFEGQNVGLAQQAGGVKVRWLDTNTGKTDDLDCKAR